MLVLVPLLFSPASAQPDRLLARVGEDLTERTYWAVDDVDVGPARPKWRNRRGTWRCWTFPDGVAAQCEQRDKATKQRILFRRFDAGGRPTTTAHFEKDQLVRLTVHGLATEDVDVSSRHAATVGPVQAYGPTPPGTSTEWKLPEGHLRVQLLDPAGDPSAETFAESLAAQCDCIIEDRASTWVAGRYAVRWRTRRLDPTEPTLSEVWVIPWDEAWVAVRFTTPATGTLQEIQARLAHGRAWVAQFEPAPPPSEAP